MPEEQTQVQTEMPTNCVSCNKPLKKRKIYYRNNQYYCNKRCWKTKTSKKVEE